MVATLNYTMGAGKVRQYFTLWICCAVCCAQGVWAGELDLSQAKVVVASPDPVVATAAEMLQEEVAKRSGVSLQRGEAPVGGPSIVIGVRGQLGAGVAAPEGLAELPQVADAYAIAAGADGMVQVIGHDARGALFGVGRLLRLLELGEGQVALQEGISIITAPRYPVRGHQMGYRETANTYDAWTLETYEQNFRDLILFGTNAIELITSLDPTFVEGKVMQRRQWDMNVDLTKLLKKYGLDVVFWMPLEGDVRDPQVAKKELEDRRAFFAACADIHDIMVPGGDPGRTHPADLMPWLEQMAGVLHERFPNAGVWVSNQKFTPVENDAFYQYIVDNRPAWLRGVVHGPSSPGSPQENRARLPKQYMLRNYPDITHSLRSQYPVGDWNRLFAQTLDREAPNPRPVDEAAIVRAICPGTDGFISYSDGAHDDYNKMLWSTLGWDPETSVEAITLDYARVFFGEKAGPKLAEGLMMLEENWRGDPLENGGIDKTLKVWEKEGNRDKALQENWRYNMYLLRAAFDAYVRERGQIERSQEEDAYAALARAPKLGAAAAIEVARAALSTPDREPPARALRSRIEALGPVLLRQIGYQLSMDPPYLAKSPERGAILDKLDRPLNDRLWLEAQFEKVLAEKDAAIQLALIDDIVHWEEPGSGSYYDDLGRMGHQPHLIGQLPYAEDPGFLRSPHDAFYRSMDNATKALDPLRYSWMDFAESGGETMPLDMVYEGLDSDAQYTLRVTYFSRFKAEMKVVADGQYEVHGPLKFTEPVWPQEFAVPKAATADGRLELQWQLVSGRGVQVAEVWLIKQPF